MSLLHSTTSILLSRCSFRSSHLMLSAPKFLRRGYSQTSNLQPSFNNNSVPIQQHNESFENTYKKQQELLETYRTRFQKLFPTNYDEMMTKFELFFEECKDVGDYEKKLQKILSQMFLLKNKENYLQIKALYHNEFIPIFTTHIKEIKQKINFELENRIHNMNIFPRLHYVIINEYLNAILKLGLFTKAVNTLRILDDGRYFPTHVHVSTVMRHITKDPSRTVEAAQLLEHFKYTYRMDRYSTFANSYSEACLSVIHGFDLAGSYNEAIDFVLRNDILKFVEQTRCGKLLAKILSILLRQKNYTLFNQLKQKYLNNILSPDFPYIKSKDRLLYVLINYHASLGDIEQTNELLSKLETKDGKLYLSVLKLLYNSKSSDFLHKFIYEAIPSLYRHNHHLGYLIRKLVDEKQFEEAKQLFLSIPKVERTYILCDQFLRCLYMEKDPKKNIIEAITVYEDLVKSKEEGQKLIYTNICAYYIMQILYDGAFHTQLESFFTSLGTVTIPQLMLMAKYYLERNNIEKVELCREEIKKIRPLPQNFREYMTI